MTKEEVRHIPTYGEVETCIDERGITCHWYTYLKDGTIIKCKDGDLKVVVDQSTFSEEDGVVDTELVDN